MFDPIADFERDCQAARIAPTAVFKAAELHPSLWWRWKNGSVSPTLRSLAAVQAKLTEMSPKGDPAATQQDAAA